MSKRFLTKLAGGVALGSAALLLGAPGAALADPPPATDLKEPKYEQEWKTPTNEQEWKQFKEDLKNKFEAYKEAGATTDQGGILCIGQNIVCPDGHAVVVDWGLLEQLLAGSDVNSLSEGWAGSGWVTPTGWVAAGDGGALSATDTTALTAAGAGMLGVAALGGLGLLRRRAANGTVA